MCMKGMYAANKKFLCTVFPRSGTDGPKRLQRFERLH